MDANQARRRTDLTFRPVHTGDSAVSQPQVETFEYSPLRQDKDHTRLVRIEPAGNNDDPISCTLVDVAFGDRPKYQALSYMWGDETRRANILLNGAKFSVTQNLFDALQFLRRRKSSDQEPVWIDAISINQSDVPERNSQLRMMPYIYFRAAAVLVWLGKKYARSNEEDARTRPESSESDGKDLSDDTITSSDGSTVGDDGALTFTNGCHTGNDADAVFAEEVGIDEYWGRVWIIQEIGKANRIHVCFGRRHIMDWEAFIKLIKFKAPKERTRGPYRLYKQLEQKYEGAHTLRNLLETHGDALCKDPRDKIYGLVGLAADAHGFPMDYGKREVDVWTDTMRFMNGRGLLRGCNLVDFGRMIRGLLLGPDGMNTVHSLAHPSPQEATNFKFVNDQHESSEPDVFRLRARVYGYIRYLGPTANEVVFDLQQAEKWATALQANFAEDLNHAHWESDSLMRSILAADEVGLARLCHNHMSVLNWRESEDYDSPFHKLNYWLSGVKAIQDKKHIPAFTAASRLMDDNDRYLIQVHQMSREFTPFKTGIASSQAEPGDLVCWVPGVKQAVLVRARFEGSSNTELHFQVCGTARMVSEFDNNAGLDGDQSRVEKLPQLDILVDAETLFIILAC